MKVAVIGIGQCGCNIADEFYNLSQYAKSLLGRRIEIVTDTLAVNTDSSDLRGFKHIPGKNRILVGAGRTFGHGVGKINVEAARIFTDDRAVLAGEISDSRHFYETDAVVVIASAAGGTGSGGIGQVTKILKERLRRRVIAMVVLPFAYEESGAVSYAQTNAATCVSTVDGYADVTFILDNEKFSRGATVSMADSYQSINQQMVSNFYDLFCAGEETVTNYVGAKVVDAGDIIASLSGISVIGRGEVSLPTFRFRKYSVDEGIRRATSVSTALSEAVNNLSTDINLKDARRLLAMLCAPKEYITQSALQEIYQTLLDNAPQAEIRTGDYPRRGREVSVTVVASELVKVPRVEKLYEEATKTFEAQKVTEAQSKNLISELKGKAKGIPRLA
jgi:cell division GTPase FtsZ